MQRGDVLYIPRGFPHMAETTGGNSSVHFTMTVMSQEFTWESFLLQLGQPGPAAVPPTPAQPLWSDEAHTAANLPEHWAALGCVQCCLRDERFVLAIMLTAALVQGEPCRLHDA